MISEIVELFVNTLTADDKYSLRNSDNLRQPIEMALPKKQKTFSDFSLFFSDLDQISNIF